MSTESTIQLPATIAAEIFFGDVRVGEVTAHGRLSKVKTNAETGKTSGGNIWYKATKNIPLNVPCDSEAAAAVLESLSANFAGEPLGGGQGVHLNKAENLVNAKAAIKPLGAQATPYMVSVVATAKKDSSDRDVVNVRFQAMVGGGLSEEGDWDGDDDISLG